MITEDTFEFVMGQYHIPTSLWGGLQRYLFDRIEPGSFLRAVMENDLVEVFKNADEHNRSQLHVLKAPNSPRFPRRVQHAS